MISVFQITRTLTLAMFAATILTMLAAGPATAALVARYHFEDNTNDSSGNGLHGDYGTWTGGNFTGGMTATYEDASLPYATAGKNVNLVAGNDAIDLSNSPQLNPTGAMSFAAWYRAGTGAQNHRIVSRIDPGDAANSSYWLLANGPGNYTEAAYWEAGSGGTVNSYTWDNPPMNVADGAWIHVATTIDTTGNGGDGRSKFYVDGVEETGIIGTAISEIATSTVRTFLGSDDPASYLATGFMDDAAFFNHALTPTEIGNIMSGDFSAYPVVPEPSSILLLGGGLLSLVLIARRRRR